MLPTGGVCMRFIKGILKLLVILIVIITIGLVAFRSSTCHQNDALPTLRCRSLSMAAGIKCMKYPSTISASTSLYPRINCGMIDVLNECRIW